MLDAFDSLWTQLAVPSPLTTNPRLSMVASLTDLRQFVADGPFPPFDHIELSLVADRLVDLARTLTDQYPDFLDRTCEAIPVAATVARNQISGEIPSGEGGVFEHLAYEILLDAWSDEVRRPDVGSLLAPYGFTGAMILLGLENCFFAHRAEQDLSLGADLKARTLAEQRRLSFWARAATCWGYAGAVVETETELPIAQVARQQQKKSQAGYRALENKTIELWTAGLESGRWTSSDTTAAADAITTELRSLAQQVLRGKQLMRGLAVGEPNKPYRWILAFEKKKRSQSM